MNEQAIAMEIIRIMRSDLTDEEKDAEIERLEEQIERLEDPGALCPERGEE